MCIFMSCGTVTDSGNGTAQDVGAISDSETLQYRSCTHDSDCVYTQNGCCDCANGGKDAAIELKKLEEFKALFHCANVSCTMIAAVPACGTGTVSCKSNLCEYTKAIEQPHQSP